MVETFLSQAAWAKCIKYFLILNYSGENLEQGFEHAPKRTKRSTAGFPCKECEYVATRAGNLKARVENKHKGVRYPCS